MRLRLLALLLAVWGTGCAVNKFVCARKGGSSWRELRTRHFVLRTDLSSERARELALELERLRDAIVRSLLGGPAAEGRVHVVAMRSRSEFDLFAPAGIDGLFTTSRWNEPTIVLAGRLRGAERVVIAHELTHLLMAAQLARLPPWFREGLAAYVETIELDDARGGVVLGGARRERTRALDRWAPGDLRDVLRHRGQLGPKQYGLAWLLVHHLVTAHPERLAALERQFAEGVEPGAAWRSAFPEWDPGDPAGLERLEAALWKHARDGLKVLLYPHAPLASIPPPEERSLGAAEVHDLRLALPWPNRGRQVPRERLLAEAAEALEEGPGIPTATAILASAGTEDGSALIQAAVRARPGDARNWVLLGAAASEGDAAREAAFRRAVEVDPLSAVAHEALARHLLATKRAAEAVAHAARAVELAPWSAGSLDTHAAALEASGDCPAALAVEERAVAGLGDAPSGELWERLSARLRRLSEACGEER